MSKPGRVTQAKRNRELAKREKQSSKEERRAVKKEQKAQKALKPSVSEEDPDLIGIFAGPQKPLNEDEIL